MLLWITVVFLGIYAVLMGFFVYHWYRLPAFNAAPGHGQSQLSVVVAARNEKDHLPKLLQALRQQTLPSKRFEVTIVDDYSTDGMAAAVQPFLSGRMRLMQPDVPPEQSSKKRALEAGVNRARGPLVVVTDADCQPHSEWLEQVALFHNAQKPVFIVAPVRLTTTRTSVLGLLQQLDFIMLQGITAASVQAGAPGLCNGANLAYEKEAFVEVGGFAGIDARASGDDMLLLHKIAKRHPGRIGYLKHPNAIVDTPAQPDWPSFLQQRIRWSSKATYYQDKRVSLVLFFVYGCNVWGLFLMVSSFFMVQHLALFLLFLALKTGLEALLLVPAARFFRQSKWLWVFPLLQPLHLLYTVVIGLLSRKKTYLWKGRRTR